jgi:hypothetical protein
MRLAAAWLPPFKIYRCIRELVSAFNMNVLSVFWENTGVFALLALITAVVMFSNFFFVERTRGPSRTAQNASGGTAVKEATSLLLAANDVLLQLSGDAISVVQFSPAFLDLIVNALSKHTLVSLLVRVKNDSEQDTVTAAVGSSPLVAAGFDMRRLLFCETVESQVPVARQLRPSVFVSAHETCVAEVHRLEGKRGFVRECVAVPVQGDTSHAVGRIATALGLATSKEKTE